MISGWFGWGRKPQPAPTVIIEPPRPPVPINDKLPIPHADDVFEWLWDLGVRRIDSFDSLVENFNDYAALYDRKIAHETGHFTPAMIADAVARSPRWHLLPDGRYRLIPNAMPLAPNHDATPESPELIKFKDERPSPDDVALWLHEQGYETVNSFEQLGEVFREYAQKFGYESVSDRVASNMISESNFWERDRRRSGKKKKFYRICIPNQENVVSIAS